MTTFLEHRLRMLRFLEQQERQRDQYPDVFDHTCPLVNEIIYSINVARDEVAGLHAERMRRDILAMSATTAQLETLLQQSLLMTQSLRNVVEFHRARRQRNGCGND